MKTKVVGHPVDVVTGAVFTAWHDFAFKGRTALVWRRFYSTANHETTAQGRGWTTPFFVRLERQDSQLALVGDEGHRHLFDEPTNDHPSEISMHGWSLYKEGKGFRLFDRAQQKHLTFVATPGRMNAFMLRQIQETSGHSIFLDYDTEGRLARIDQRSLGRILAISYNEESLIERISLVVVGWRPQTLVTFQYDAERHLIQAIDPCGGAIQYCYDENHRLVRETNQLGGEFFFTYDNDGRCTHTWGDGGFLDRRLTFDTRRRISSVANSIGAVSTYHYGSDGLITKQIDPFGNVTTFHRSAGVEQRVNALGGLTERRFSERGELLQTTNELGHSFSFVYNDRSQCTTITDPGGSIWRRKYDERSLLVGLIDPLGSEWRLERGASSEVTEQVDPEGRRLVRRYDPHMRWQEIADTAGYFRCEYDRFGRAIISADANGLICTWAYDDCGRLIRTTWPDHTSIELRYNAAGNLVWRKDQSGAEWHFSYDRFGHMIAAKDPLGGEVTIEYDTDGRRVAITNQSGERYEDTYDAAGRLTETRYFDGSKNAYGWDEIGRLIHIRNGSGALIERRYDLVGNMIMEVAHEPAKNAVVDEPAAMTVTRVEYDWRGYVTKAINSDATIGFVYDEAGRLIRENQDEYEIGYRYDHAGKLIHRELLQGWVGGVAFKYNGAGLMSEIADAAGLVEAFAYDRSGRVVERTMRGDFCERFAYDSRSRIATQTVVEDSKSLVEREYTFDDRDNLIRLKDSRSGTSSFHYDAALRLSTVASNGRPQDTFTYNAAGDIVKHNSLVFTYHPGSRLTEVDDVHFEYDSAGNQTRRAVGADVTDFGYDAHGRLRKVTVSSGRSTEYGYDALGRRIFKRSADGETRFVWSNKVLAGVVDSAGAPIELLIGSRSWIPSVMWRGKAPEHYVCDHIGVPYEVLSPKAGVVWRARYAPFGSASVSCASACTGYNLRLPGQFEDSESGLFHNCHRYYDPMQARYLTKDPVGVDGGINLYDYPRDPINWTDPLGLSCPNPQLVEENQQAGWQIHEHADGSLTITADCTRGFATPKPGGLRATIHAGDDNKFNPPEAHLGQDGRLIVMEGTHRSVAASRGQQIPPDPDHPHLGGVPGRPGYMTYEYSPQYNDNSQGVPLQSLNYPPGYPHSL